MKIEICKCGHNKFIHGKNGACRGIHMVLPEGKDIKDLNDDDLIELSLCECEKYSYVGTKEIYNENNQTDDDIV